MKAIYMTVALCLCLLSTTRAGIIGPHPDELVDSPPQYEFHYSVHDSHTGDVKDQFEHRRGEYVTGRYSLIEPDGHRRVVDYSSDPLLGFNAHVRRELPIVRQLAAINHPVPRVAAELVEAWPPAPARH